MMMMLKLTAKHFELLPVSKTILQFYIQELTLYCQDPCTVNATVMSTYTWESLDSKKLEKLS